MNFKTLNSAFVVYAMYLKSRYYAFGWLHWLKAFADYRSEQQRLQATILVERHLGFVVGTLMVSKDAGWLPTDRLFPEQTAELRRLYGDRLGYCGKFGVLSFFRQSLISLKLFRQMAVNWAPLFNVTVITMIVNPKHVRGYEALGATVLGYSDQTVDLKEAPGVMMVLDMSTSKRVQSRIERALRSVSKESTSKVTV